jgi:Uma2 family endonuclease
MTVSTKLITAEDLFAMGSDAPYELINGELHEVSPTSAEATTITFRLGRLIGNFVDELQLGECASADGGFVLRRNPDTVVAPDVGFIRTERIPPGFDYQTFFPVAPDLAVEVVSPSNTQPEILRKVSLYAEAGVPLVWVVYPRRQAVTVHELGEPPRTLRAGEVLDGGDVLPGFRLEIEPIFRRRLG